MPDNTINIESQNQIQSKAFIARLKALREEIDEIHNKWRQLLDAAEYNSRSAENFEDSVRMAVEIYKIRELEEVFKKEVYKIYERISEFICMGIVNTDSHNIKVDGNTVTARPLSRWFIEDADLFYNWTKENNICANQHEFYKLVTSNEALNDLLEDQYINFDKFPPGIKAYQKGAITMRAVKHKSNKPDYIK